MCYPALPAILASADMERYHRDMNLDIQVKITHQEEERRKTTAEMLQPKKDKKKIAVFIELQLQTNASRNTDSLCRRITHCTENN